jgi:hypothetical protein
VHSIHHMDFPCEGQRACCRQRIPIMIDCQRPRQASDRYSPMTIRWHTSFLGALQGSREINILVPHALARSPQPDSALVHGPERTIHMPSLGVPQHSIILLVQTGLRAKPNPERRVCMHPGRTCSSKHDGVVHNCAPARPHIHTNETMPMTETAAAHRPLCHALGVSTNLCKHKGPFL